MCFFVFFLGGVGKLFNRLNYDSEIRQPYTAILAEVLWTEESVNYDLYLS